MSQCALRDVHVNRQTRLRVRSIDRSLDDRDLGFDSNNQEFLINYGTRS